MFDLTKESPIPLSEACRLVPPGRGGKKTHISTILRWILDGATSPTGVVVRLEAARLGGRWVTSREALRRFAERLTPQLADSSAPPPRSSSARSKASEAAARQLEAAGL